MEGGIRIMTEIPVEVKAWAAGFWEGEGSVTIFKRASRKRCLGFSHKLRCTAGQRKPAPLEILRENWGGSIHYRDKKCHAWTISSASAARFLRDIRPHLRFRGEQAGIALEFSQTMGDSNQLVTQSKFNLRDELREKLLTLNGYYRRKYGRED